MSDTLVALSAISLAAEKALFGVPTATVVGIAATGANTATFTGKTGQQWCLCDVSVSFAATTTAASTLTIKDGTTVIWQVELPTLTSPAPVVLSFAKRPLHASSAANLVIGLTSPGAIASTISASGFLVTQP
jgi:hypothetical protein